MTTQKFITNRTKKLGDGTTRIFHTMWEVTTEELSDVPEHMKVCRWYPEFGGKIKAVRRVNVRSDIYMPEHPSTEIPSHNWGDTVIEIETDHAIACIVDFTSGAEVGGVIVKGSARGRGKNLCMTLGTWRKYGHKRGHGMAWIRAKFHQGLCKSPESGSDVCPAEAYATLSGKK